MKIAAGLVIAMATLGPSAASAPSDKQRSAKQEAKRLDAIAKLMPATVSTRVDIEDDPLEQTVMMTTEDAFTWKGGFTDTVKADNFLRATLDRPTGSPTYQVYQTVTYSGDWRRFEYVNVALPSGLKTLPLTVIDRRVVTCQYGPCVLEEIVGFNIAGEEMRLIAAQYDADPKARLKFRFKSATSFDWSDDIPAAEIAGMLGAVADWRRAKGFQ